MLFFSKNRTDKNVKKAPKSPGLAGSALRIAFKPEIGASLRPLRETTDMFVQILAMIFIAFKMFPENHPDYLGRDGRHLTLATLLSVSWADLKFTRAELPKVLIFFALIIGLVFATVAFFLIMLSLIGALFVGKAHADGYYTTSAGDDIAQQWIDFLFKGDISGDFFSGYGQPLMQSGAIQASLIQALGFYSDAILIVAAVILFYHLASMTVETAHEGVVMGKRANQIWAPIRLVVAIGLLVPIGGGLNSGQYIVIKMTEWGSALASNVWSIFLTGLVEQMSMNGVPTVAPYSRETVYNTFLTEVCRATFNAYDGNASKVSGNPQNQVQDHELDDHGFHNVDVGQQKTDVANIRRCGSHSFGPAETPSSGDQNASAMQSLVPMQAQMCYAQMQQEVAQLAQTYSKNFIVDAAGGTNSQPTPPYDGGLDGAVSDYASCLSNGLPVPALLGIFANSQAWGWVSAGATLSAVAQAQSDAADVGGLIPSTTAPDFSGELKDQSMKEAKEVTEKVDRYVKALPQGGSSGGGGNIGGDACAANRANMPQQLAAMQQQGAAKDHLLERVFQLIDWIAGWNCVWNSAPANLNAGNFTLAIEFTGANPLAEMAHLGHANINAAYEVFDVYVNYMASTGKEIAGDKAENGTVNKGGVLNLGTEGNTGAMTAIGGLLGMICSVFFTSGVMLAFYLPLIPFFQFLFSIMTWIVSVLEAVICAPLLALAHLTVEGQGLPGSMAKRGYFFVFNIFMRPVMTVFGLIVGLLIFYVAVSYMNLFYQFAISSSGGLANGHLFLSRLVYSILYVLTLYTCANSAFKAIHWIPEHSNHWLGAESMHFQKMAEPEQLASTLQSGAGMLDSKILSGIQAGGFGAAAAYGGAGGLPEGRTMGGIIAYNKALAGKGGAPEQPPAPSNNPPASNPPASNPPAATPPKPPGGES